MYSPKTSATNFVHELCTCRAKENLAPLLQLVTSTFDVFAVSKCHRLMWFMSNYLFWLFTHCFDCTCFYTYATGHAHQHQVPPELGTSMTHVFLMTILVGSSAAGHSLTGGGPPDRWGPASGWGFVQCAQEEGQPYC